MADARLPSGKRLLKTVTRVRVRASHGGYGTVAIFSGVEEAGPAEAVFYQENGYRGSKPPHQEWASAGATAAQMQPRATRSSRPRCRHLRSALCNALILPIASFAFRAYPAGFHRRLYTTAESRTSPQAAPSVRLSLRRQAAHRFAGRCAG